MGTWSEVLRIIQTGSELTESSEKRRGETLQHDPNWQDKSTILGQH